MGNLLRKKVTIGKNNEKKMFNMSSLFQNFIIIE